MRRKRYRIALANFCILVARRGSMSGTGSSCDRRCAIHHRRIHRWMKVRYSRCCGTVTRYRLCRGHAPCRIRSGTNPRWMLHSRSCCAIAMIGAESNRVGDSVASCRPLGCSSLWGVSRIAWCTARMAQVRAPLIRYQHRTLMLHVLSCFECRCRYTTPCIGARP